MVLQNTNEKTFNSIHVFLLLIACLLFTRCFNILGWDLFFGVRYYIIIGGVITLLVVGAALKTKTSRQICEKYATLLFIWPIVNLFFTTIMGNSLYDELVNSFSWTYIIGIFWILKKYKVTERTIIITLTIFAIATCVIQIYEQINPELAIFGVIDPTADNYMGEIADMRNDLYRLKVGSAFIQIFCFFYYWDRVISKKQYVYLIIVFLLAASIYLYLTRQLIIAVSATCLLSLILQNTNSSKRVAFILLLFFGYALINNYEVLFGSLVSDYSDNTYTTDIRWECMSNTLSWQFDNLLSFIIGAGHPIYLLERWYTKGYDMSDIGFIGAGFYYGLIWVVAYFKFVVTLLRKHRKQLPNYIILYFISTAIMSLFIFPYTNAPGIFVWTCTIYIVNLYVNMKVENV